MKKLLLALLSLVATSTASFAAQSCLTNLQVYAESNSILELPTPANYTSTNFTSGLYLISYPDIDFSDWCYNPNGPLIELTFKGDHCSSSTERIGEIWWNCAPACDPSGTQHKLDIQVGPGIHSVLFQIILVPDANCAISYCIRGIVSCTSPADDFSDSAKGAAAQ